MIRGRWGYRGMAIPAAAGLLLIFAGCGIYTFSGNVPRHLKTVAIPTFENQTPEFGLAETLTDEVVTLFTRDGALRVRGVNGADSVIRGSIVQIQDRPYNVTTQGTTEEYRVTIVVQVAFEDMVKDEIIWEESISQFDVYKAGGADRDDGIERAAAKIAEDILNKTVSGW